MQQDYNFWKEFSQNYLRSVSSHGQFKQHLSNRHKYWIYCWKIIMYNCATNPQFQLTHNKHYILHKALVYFKKYSTSCRLVTQLMKLELRDNIRRLMLLLPTKDFTLQVHHILQVWPKNVNKPLQQSGNMTTCSTCIIQLFSPDKSKAMPTSAT
jgi:hypothetical protein